MSYQQENRPGGPRAWMEAGGQLLAPAPRMQRRAGRRSRLDRRYDAAWNVGDVRAPGLVRIVVLTVFAAAAFAYQMFFLSDKLR